MSEAPESAPETLRLKLVVRGAVQGVGFRPFVFRLARGLGLAGWVNNSAQGVFIELEGSRPALTEFFDRLEREKPPRSFIQSLESCWLDPVGYTGFQIRESDQTGARSALVMPDIATCADCLAEISDPKNRRHFYPFTNCTNCGPRFSIIESLPYDRCNTSMKQFTMCPQCQAEYDSPVDRRFHAQPNACPVCGPRIELWGPNGELLRKSDRSEAGEPLRAAAEAIAAGRIVAVKGLGGFHLMTVAQDKSALERLRTRKQRDEKPLAVMFPSLEAIREVCQVSPVEERLLRSPEMPIVLLPRHSSTSTGIVSLAVAPGNPNLGVMLPYTPLHHLLLSLLGFPVVATSGNLTDEPICIDEHEALQRLNGVADLFLVHNRPIVRHVDDSIVRVVAGREMVLRRARGYAPLPIELQIKECNPAPSKAAQASADPEAKTMLAVGAHLKNTVGLGLGRNVFISQHIGDLETVKAYDAFERVAGDLQQLFDAPAALLVADSHPDYLSTKFARSAGVPFMAVQHHVAHVLSCMAENHVQPPVLGVAWDGTGYGLDGTVWGGEFFHIHEKGFERVAHFRQFRLPGGEQAVREARRSAAGMLFDTLGAAAFEQSEQPSIGAFSAAELSALSTMLARGINSPLTSSAGRIFDAVASLTGLRQTSRFEGQAAMELEFILEPKPNEDAYELLIVDEADPAIVDWRPMIKELLADHQAGVSRAKMSLKFHNGLVESILNIAKGAGLERVVLSGGCFQNRYLTEASVRRLTKAGFRPYWHQRVPPNDGGICLGQVVAARWWSV